MITVYSFQITPDDELTKMLCSSCCAKVEDLYVFVLKSYETTKELLIEHRKTTTPKLDFATHLYRYIRNFDSIKTTSHELGDLLNESCEPSDELASDPLEVINN